MKNQKQGWIVVLVLMMAYVFSFVDRNIVILLVEVMKKDMNLSDTKVSLLLGASFALFYSILGIPLGRLADVYSRKKIIAVGIALWSIMTAVCGLAKNYGQLFLARMGVGVGEAALSPAAYSIISDYFPKEKLATAISVYSLGIYIGSALAYVGGGYLIGILSEMDNFNLPIVGEIYAWQFVFVIVGLPGLLMAALVLLIKEPERQGENAGEVLPFKEVWAYLKEHGRTFFLLCAAFAFFYVAVYATSSWIPTYLIRIHGLSEERVGIIAGVGLLLFPAIGVLSSGFIADKWTAQGVPNAKIRWSLWATLFFIPATAVYPFMPTTTSTLIALIPYGILVSATVGVAAAAIQEIMPNRMRGVASALLILAQNLVGLTLGPTGVALLTDYVFQDEMALGWSLVIMSVSSLSIATVLFYFALRSAGKDEAQEVGENILDS
jgi:MFS family permease